MVEWCSVMHFLVKFYPWLEFSFLVSHSLTNVPCFQILLFWKILHVLYLLYSTFPLLVIVRFFCFQIPEKLLVCHYLFRLRWHWIKNSLSALWTQQREFQKTPRHKNRGRGIAWGWFFVLQWFLFYLSSYERPAFTFNRACLKADFDRHG